MSFKQFRDRLGFVEFTDNYQAANSLGYLGNYQLGELALRYIGVYLDDGTPTNDWIGTWQNLPGVNSKEDFLANPFVRSVR